MEIPANHETVKRAISRGSGFVAGLWVCLETQQETTLDQMCAEIERGGGIVVSIEEYDAPPKSGSGAKTYRRTFILTACLREC